MPRIETSSFTDRNFSSGMFSGLTVPPSPISDIFTYTNRLDQKVMLRMTFSPLLKSFVNLEIGLGLDSLKFFVSLVVDFVQRLLGVRKCEMVLLQ